MEKNLQYTVVPNGGRLAFRLLDVVLNDVLVIIPGMILMLLVSKLYGWGAAALLVLVISGLMFRYPYGRGYGVIADKARSFYIRTVLRGVLWDPDPSLGFLGRKLKQRPPFHDSVQRIDAGRHRVSVLHNERKKSDLLFIVGGGSNAAALNHDGYQAFNNAVADIIKHAKAETQLQIGTSYGRLLRPYDQWQFAMSLSGIMDPDVAVPEGLVTDLDGLTPRQRVEFRLYQNTNQLKDMVAFRGAEPVYMCVVTVKRPTAWGKMKRRDLSERELYKAPLIRIANTIVSDLDQIGVTDVKVLTLTELARLYRMSWDIATLDTYQQACVNGKIPVRDDQLEVTDDGEVLSDTMHLPEGRITVGHDWINIAGTYHRTLRVKEFPRQILPNVMHLFYSETSHMSSVVFSGETISGRAESSKFTYGITFMRGLERARGRKVYETYSEKLKRSDMEQRHADIQRSGTVGQHGNVFITVSGRSIEDLDDAQHAFEKLARGRGMRMSVVTGESRQLPAMQTGTLAANRM